MREMWGVRPSHVARWSWEEYQYPFVGKTWLIAVTLTKREFFRHEITSGGRVVAMSWWVVVAESS